MDKKDWHPCTCQIMYHFSQKIVAMTNALVFTCLFFLCLHWNNTKKSEKKCQIWLDSTQNSKNGLDKMIGTLKLIFGSIPFGKNNWNQSLPLTMNECLTTLYWNFGPLFFCQLLQVSHIWRVPSPNCCFEIMPQVCYGIKIWTHLGHFRTLQCFVLTLSGCFLKCAMGHCPAGRPMTTDGDPASDTGPYIAPKNSLVVLRFHDAMHTVKALGSRSSKATQKHWSTSTMFDCRDRVLFCEGLISFL